MVAQMKPGSVIVDLAAEQGGNCACTDPGKDVQWNGVTIIGPINLPSSMPVHASQMYAKNLSTLVQYLIKDNALQLNFETTSLKLLALPMPVRFATKECEML
jgi:NAD(P) transhydrogenase subunit alpha